MRKGGRLTAEAALIAQAWLGVGNASNTDIAGLNGLADHNNTSDTNMGFFGGRFTVGLDY